LVEYFSFSMMLTWFINQRRLRLIEKIRHSHDVVLAVLSDLFLLVYCIRPGVTNALSFAYSVLLLADYL